MAEPIGLAVVGGRRGGAFNRALETFRERVELVAVCDLSEAVLARWREQHPGIATYQSYDRLLVLRRDSGSPRPHNMVHYQLQGTKAAYLSPRHRKEDPLIWIDGRSPGVSPSSAAEWESLWTYADQYEHPRWRARGHEAVGLGHGGGDFFVIDDFLRAIESGQPPAIDVYQAVTWSAIAPLSLVSVERGGAPVEVPDFRASRARVPA